MNAEQIRNSWDDDHDVTRPCAFPEPLAEVLTRENRELRAEVERLTQERDRAREDCGFQKGLKESIREELSNFIRLKQDAEAELADATMAAQNLRDELQGAQERLRAMATLLVNEGHLTPQGQRQLLKLATPAALDAEP